MANVYETVIGLEVHVELATQTKIFCGCSTAFGGAPNTHTCPVCTGMPGTLPVLNRQVVEHAIAVGLATNCSIAGHCRFDRKNYFYPDNPQNYQISQLYQPICRDGYVEIDVQTPEGDRRDAAERDRRNVSEPDNRKRVRIHEIHMEEDAGKLIHDGESGRSLVDYNRAGVPLIEIVSEPDMRSAEEVIAYLEKLRTTIQYLGASDCKLQEGSMRADVNLSVREVGVQTLGTRTEMKNLNSFHAIRNAIAGERERQIRLLESGEQVVQETRRWDDARGVSYSMRSKEDAQDYRYFPEPDLAPLHIDDAWIAQIRARQPELREERMERYQRTYALPMYDIRLLTDSKQLSDLFEETVACGAQPKKVSNWLMGEALRLLRERDMDPEEICFTPEHLAALIGLVEQKEITSTVGKEVFAVMFTQGVDPRRYVEENGLKTLQDADALRRVAAQVLADNPQSVADYRNGKEKAIGFLVGQTMKAMKGQADPLKVREILQSML